MLTAALACALAKPGARVLVLGASWEHANTLLPEMFMRLAPPEAVFQRAERRAVLPNGSLVRFAARDNDLRGMRWDGEFTDHAVWERS